MNELSLAERETHLSMAGDDHNTWVVFSDDPVLMRKLDKIGEIIRVVGAGKEYKLGANQITLKATPKPLSEARKAQLAQQARTMRQGLVITSEVGLQMAR
ncbi:hypothetical protein BH10CHL1_BH10CHL1_24310 [soil metagenome]